MAFMSMGFPGVLAASFSLMICVDILRLVLVIGVVRRKKAARVLPEEVLVGLPGSMMRPGLNWASLLTVELWNADLSKMKQSSIREAGLNFPYFL